MAAGTQVSPYGEHTATGTNSPFSMGPRCRVLLCQVWTVVGEFGAGKILEEKVSPLGSPPPKVVFPGKPHPTRAMTHLQILSFWHENSCRH